MSQEYGPAIAGSSGSGAKAAIKVLVDEMLQSSSGDEIYFQAHSDGWWQNYLLSQMINYEGKLWR